MVDLEYRLSALGALDATLFYPSIAAATHAAPYDPGQRVHRSPAVFALYARRFSSF